jgi:Flp pilus assembly protein TadG
MTIRRLARCERGAQLIEFSLAFPLLLLVAIGIVDFGFLFQRLEVVTNAAREGARVAILPGYSEDTARARVNQFLTASGVTGTPSVSFQPPVGVDVGGVCITLTGVTVSLPHTYGAVGPLMGLFGSTSLTTTSLNATAWMRYEGPAVACP